MDGETIEIDADALAARLNVDQAIQACSVACFGRGLGPDEELEVFSELMRSRLYFLADCDDKAFEDALEKIIRETRAGYNDDKREWREEDLA
jgi:hypothetical protein